MLFELGSFADSAARSTQGYAHNLDESFDRVNAAYFRGSMPKPNLVWNRTLTGRKLGHYQPGTDTVMLSVSLDDPSVPACVVDFVMYHELLQMSCLTFTITPYPFDQAGVFQFGQVAADRTLRPALRQAQHESVQVVVCGAVGAVW